MKAAVAAMHWIISSAAKYNVEDTTLSTELQQLGLPKGGGSLLLKERTELCDVLAKLYREKKEQLREHFTGQTLKRERDWLF